MRRHERERELKIEPDLAKGGQVWSLISESLHRLIFNQPITSVYSVNIDNKGVQKNKFGQRLFPNSQFHFTFPLIYSDIFQNMYFNKRTFTQHKHKTLLQLSQVVFERLLAQCFSLTKQAIPTTFRTVRRIADQFSFNRHGPSFKTVTSFLHLLAAMMKNPFYSHCLLLMAFRTTCMWVQSSSKQHFWNGYLQRIICTLLWQ